MTSDRQRNSVQCCDLVETCCKISNTCQFLFFYHALYINASSIFTRMGKNICEPLGIFAAFTAAVVWGGKYLIYSIRRWRQLITVQFSAVSWRLAKAGALVFSFFYCGYNIIRLVFPLCLLLRLRRILRDPVWRQSAVSTGVQSIICLLCLHDQHSVISAFLQRSGVSYVRLWCRLTPLVAGYSDWCSVMKCDTRCLDVIFIIYTLVYWI